MLAFFFCFSSCGFPLFFFFFLEDITFSCQIPLLAHSNQTPAFNHRSFATWKLNYELRFHQNVINTHVNNILPHFFSRQKSHRPIFLSVPLQNHPTSPNRAALVSKIILSREGWAGGGGGGGKRWGGVGGLNMDDFRHKNPFLEMWAFLTNVPLNVPSRGRACCPAFNRLILAFKRSEMMGRSPKPKRILVFRGSRRFRGEGVRSRVYFCRIMGLSM